MQDRIREILSWYGSDNPGTLTNLARLLNHGALGGTGKLVILPVDQGVEHGPGRSFAPNPPAYDPRYHFELAIDAGLSAYAAPLGFLEAGARDYAGDLPLILKLNNRENLHSDADPTQSLTGSIAAALRLGCVGIGYTVYPGSALRQEMYEKLQALAEEAKRYGLARGGLVLSARHGLEQGRGNRARRHCVRRPNRRPARGPCYQGQTAYGSH